MAFFDIINDSFENFQNDNKCHDSFDLFNMESEIIRIYKKCKYNFEKLISNIFLVYILNNPEFNTKYLEDLNILEKNIIIAYIKTNNMKYYNDIIKIQVYNIND